MYNDLEGKPMDVGYYQQMTRTTRNPDLSIKELEANAVFGLLGEMGEVADHLKKARFQGHEVDVAKIKDEMGDVMWYMSLLADVYGLQLSEILEGNIQKLMARYPDGFSEYKSKKREVK